MPKTIAATLASDVIMGRGSCSCCGSVCCGKLFGALCPVGNDGGCAAGVDVCVDCPFLSVWLLISVTVDVMVGRGSFDKVVPVIWGVDEMFAEEIMLLNKDASGICDEAAVGSGPIVCTGPDDVEVDDAEAALVVAVFCCCFFSSFFFCSSSSSESESLSDDCEPMDDALLCGESGLLGLFCSPPATADGAMATSRRRRLWMIVTGDGRRSW